MQVQGSEISSKIRRLEIRSRRLVEDRYAGLYHSTFKGSGIEFEEVRPYTPGDDIRDIDWNVSARSKKQDVFIPSTLQRRICNTLALV